MNRTKRLATESPLIFGLAVTLTFILMVIITSVIAKRWPAESPRWYFASTIGRVVSIALLLAVLARLEWLRPAGLTRPGRWPTWLIVLPLLAYSMAVSTYAMTGGFNFRFSAPALPGVAALFLMTHALFEEVVFRGLVMVAFVKVWGGTTRGLTRSVLVSSLIFAAMHLVNVLGGNPLPVVLLQSAGALFQGILYGALLLRGRSIYPVAILHGLANVAAYVMLTANPSAGTTPSAWLLQSVLMLPLAIIGTYILRDMPQRAIVPGTA
jgi:membrane protease YdiL (CAAX protease family)